MTRHILLFLLLTTLTARAAVGDLIINYQANNTGPASELRWTKANSTIWGTNSSGVITGFTLGDNLTLGGGSTLGVITATGGQGTADANKIVVFDSNGQLRVTNVLTVQNSSGTTYATYQHDSMVFQQSNGRFYSIQFPTLSASRVVSWPDKSGTLATTGDITPAQLTQSGATTGQGIVWNGTIWAPGTVGGALTVGTTNISSGTGGRLMYETAGNKLGEISGVTSDGTSLLFSSSATLSWNSDAYVSREAAAVLQLGADVNGDAVDQTVKAADGITGTDRNGGDLTLSSGNSTGAGASAVIFKAPVAGSSGTTARTAVERGRVDSNGVRAGKIIVWGDPTTAPPAGVSGDFYYLFVDPADGNFKVQSGTSGQVTTLATP